MASSPTPPVKAPVSPVLIILLGLLFLIIAIIVGGVIFYKNCEKCQEVVAGLSEGTTAIVKGMNAPGTAEIRALGCDQAMAIDMQAFEKMFAPLAGEEMIFDANMRDMKMLMCKQESFSVPEGPECADVIRAWAAVAAEGHEAALVVVQGRSSRSNYCQGIYAVDGTLISDLAGEF